MIFSICIYCGKPKSKPLIKCKACSKTPAGSDLDMAKSIILSTSPDDNGEPFTSKNELMAIGDKLSKSQDYTYDEGTLDDLLVQKKMLDESPQIQWGFLFFGFCFLIIPIIALVMFIRS
jgi:hypothetical protein